MNGPGRHAIPEALALLCLRGGSGIKPHTYALHVRQILDVLAQDTIEVLHLPVFIIRAPDFIEWSCAAQPILYKAHNADQTSMTYTQLYTGEYATISVDPTACAQLNIAVEAVEQHIERLEQAYLQLTPLRIQFSAGDLLVLDNRFTQHARSIFTPDISDRTQVRWLLRAYAVDHSV